MGCARSIPMEQRLEHLTERSDRLVSRDTGTNDICVPMPPNSSKSKRRKENQTSNLVALRKFSSCSTLFVTSTAQAPQLESTLMTLALALLNKIKLGHEKEATDSFKLYSNNFDEGKFPLTDAPVPDNYRDRIPRQVEIYQFLHRLFSAAQLTAECGVVTFVYTDRAMSYSGMIMHASNWKRLVLSAIIMASKVWDDQAVWNVDFCQIFPKMHVEEINDLERTFIEMVEFNVNVDMSTYIRYYFALRNLAEKDNKNFPLQPLTKSQAQDLELNTSNVSTDVKKQSMRNAKSLDFENSSEFKKLAMLSL